MGLRGTGTLLPLPYWKPAVVLKPDAFAEPGWLAALVSAAEREPAVAAFACQMLLASDPRYLDGAGDSYHVSGRARRNGHRVSCSTWPAADGEVFAPCAAAALYRREAFEEVDGFDEQFFCGLALCANSAQN